MITQVLRAEEDQFSLTVAKGMALLEEEFARATPPGAGARPALPGAVVFKLHDTYGFPPDLTADIARERNVDVDMAGYEREMEQQRERARAASRFGVDLRGAAAIDAQSEFSGYEALEGESQVIVLRRGGVEVAVLQAGEQGEIVLARTPFYAESGGQVGDTGVLMGANGARFAVVDTQKSGHAAVHLGTLTGAPIAKGDTLRAVVDAPRRAATRLNHSATHLLHAALRQVLGNHVTQKGSLVTPERLRFDFAHFQAVTAEELARVEHQVNAQVRANAAAETRLMDYDQAVAAGAMALFGEKYDREVRVLSIGNFSTELCGGTHVARAGDIGLFRIISESGVAAGVRRIEAVTGEGALESVARTESALREVAGLVRGTRDEVVDKVRDALERIRAQEKEIRALKEKLASGQGTDLAATAVDVGGIKVVAARVDGADATALRAAVDQLKDKLGAAVIVLAAVEAPNKIVLVAGVTSAQTKLIKAGELVGAIAQLVGGKGGGRPDFAQAGGSQPEALDAALATVAARVQEKIPR
jgi:alanyl-tRNA synthetase